jgi:hypothetical protein
MLFFRKNLSRLGEIEMAKKPKRKPVGKPVKTTAKRRSPAPKPVRAAAPRATAVRNTAVPKATTAPKPIITREMIAKRAFEISMSPECGSEFDNWLRAERDLGVR